MQDPTSEKLASQDPDADTYERLRQKHMRCEERLAELQSRLILSEEEKLEEVNLKKQKLQLKDRMEGIARSRLGTGAPRAR